MIKGEKVWSVSIDINAINAAGNLLDACGIAAMAALLDTTFPHYDEENGVDYEKKTKDKLPIDKQPLPVTVYKAGENLFVDPLEDEENVYEARLTVTTTKDGLLCAMQKGGETPLTIDEIDTMVGLALDKSKEIRKLIK